ncbi:MAG: IPT/TIG domain-containing protein, partial [Planctomycetota bacterium]
MGAPHVGTVLAAVVCGIAVAIAAGCKKSSSSTPAAPVVPPPSPLAVAPAGGPQAGGTLITITGSAFLSGATVTVGGVAATGVTFVSTGQLTCTTAAMTPQVGPVNIVVTNPDNQSGTLTGQFALTGPAPVLMLAAPTAGIAAGGTTLYLTGRDFAPGATVTVGGSAATVTFNSTTALTVTTPSGTAGAANIVVTNPDAQASTLTGGFTYWSAAPTITNINPNTGPTGGGTTVTITGTNFSTSPAAVVEFAGSTASVSSNDGSTIVCTTPNMNAFGYPRIGPQNVSVVNPDGQGATVVGGFTATGATPTITSFTPATGSTNGGTRVTITGTNFDPILDGSVTASTVSFGSAAATVVDVRSSTQIICYAPAGSGNVTITVTNVDGNSGNSASQFGYAAGPVVTGGTAVTITGTGFAAGDTVAFGAGAATAVNVVNATTITCTTPAGPLQRVDVTVTPSTGPSS